jgi:hypothetical protein
MVKQFSSLLLWETANRESGMCVEQTQSMPTLSIPTVLLGDRLGLLWAAKDEFLTALEQKFKAIPQRSQ